MPRGRTSGPLSADTKGRFLASMAARGKWPNAVPWSPERDATVLRMRAAGNTFKVIGQFVGVSERTARERFLFLRPDLKNGEGGIGVPPPLVFVSAAQFRAHSLHAPNMPLETAHRAVCFTQRRVPDARP